jgi:exopolysaccharide biosynthesis predicted pyruvyltransferase EpsI/drug/metabolite transporter (DMT)-like permease
MLPERDTEASVKEESASLTPERNNIIDQTTPFKFEASTSITKSIGLLAAWYSSAALAAWHLSRVLQNTDFESIEVSLLLMMAGTLLTIFNLFADSSFYGKAVAAFKMRSTHQASLWHYTGTLSMCMAQAAVSASLAQIVKSTEPVLTIAFSWMLSGINLGPRKFFGVIFISLGVAIGCTGDKSLESSGVLYALISACCFPLRNLASFKCDDKLTSTQRFGLVSTCGCIPALVLCLAKWWMFDSRAWNIMPFGRLTIASMSHVGYNVASYAFLGSSSPIFHSVANILKRLVVTVSMFAMDEKLPSKMEVLGFCLLVSGFVFCSEIKISCRSYLPLLLPFIISTLSFTLLSGDFLFNPFIGHHPIVNALVPAAPASSATPPSQPDYSPAKLLSCIAGIRRRHMEELKDIFLQPRFKDHPILLVDPAQHGNIGDVLLVQGEKHFLNALGWGERSVHECGVAQDKVGPRCPAFLEAAGPGAYKLALWQAGGNWGDIWRGTQGQRVRSMRYLLDAQLTVVSMPQSMHYNNASVAEHEARVIGAAAASVGGPKESRKRLIFLWRQANSHASAARLYPFADNRLVPDMAFWCGPYLHHGTVGRGSDGTARVDLLLFLRTDIESVHGGAGLHKSPDSLRRMVDAAGAGRNISFRVVDWNKVRNLRAVNQAEYQPKIEAAVRLLDGGRVVVADRLHATILALLSLKPVFYVDQSYGKIQHTLDAAFASSDDCRDERAVRVFPTASLAEALPRAVRFLGQCKASGECP